MHVKGTFIFTQEPGNSLGTSYSVTLGEALDSLHQMPDDSVRCWVTSPPYFHVCDYSVHGQTGTEPTVERYIAYQKMVAAEMLRASTTDANLFWIVRDSWNQSGGTGGDYRRKDGSYGAHRTRGANVPDIPRKSRLCIPEHTVIAFKDAGWIPILPLLVEDSPPLDAPFIWDKQDARRGAKDRPSYSYEHVLLFSKSPDHYWDRTAVLGPYSPNSLAQLERELKGQCTYDYGLEGKENPSDVKRRIIESMKSRPGAYLKAVWQIPPGRQPEVTLDDGSKVRGIASFPLLLAEICVNLGSAPGDIVGDPYAGMGTSLLAARKWGREAYGIELNPRFYEACLKRLENYAERDQQ